ncbi:CxC2 domain-containing protein [Favolaschia claudopus]|uniref:CxC2 domain-containing protein n=1 Tax=Favolaschia claudopus TaxID=2862362 RepID=A0AAV9Z6C8_9AGAR
MWVRTCERGAHRMTEPGNAVPEVGARVGCPLRGIRMMEPLGAVGVTTLGSCAATSSSDSSSSDGASDSASESGPSSRRASNSLRRMLGSERATVEESVKGLNSAPDRGATSPAANTSLINPSRSLLRVPANHPVETVVERPSADGRRVHSEIFPIPPSSPIKRARIQGLHHLNSSEHAATQPEGSVVPSELTRHSRLPFNKLLLEFIPLRDEYLREFLRLDGCGDASEDLCPGCGVHPPRIRCLDCHNGFGADCFGHADCTRRHPGHTNFVVLDTNGVHEVNVEFCACERRLEMGSVRTQLLMDGAGDVPPKRYVEFLRMARFFRHIMMLKRGGRGHALAIRCPACPRPGINLPDDWQSAPPEKRFLYIFFLALDACFRLKRRLISSALRDPGLGTGWSYFLEPEPYRKFLLTVTKQDEMSTCSGLAALDYANTKFSTGYSVTGPTGVGDLQKGERYSNMDYIYASILRWLHRRLRKVVSYDIVCQWFKNLRERLQDLPPLVRLSLILHLCAFVIPKMHIHAHILACQLLFSLNLLAGAGQTDGEGIERPWANLGGVASSTREMGPGSRADVLDDHFAFWNWCKVLALVSALLRKRLDKARRERESERIQGWEKQKYKNPYEIKTKALKEADVRLRLAEEEDASVRRGVLALHDVSPSAFIFEGLELEDQQRRIRAQVLLKKAGTTAQQIDILAMRRKLTRGIARFRKLQATYTPGALQALARRAPNRRRADSLLTKKLHVRNQGANTRARNLVARNESKILLHSAKYQAAWAALRELNGGAKQGWRRLRREDVRTMEDPEELTKREAIRKKQAERRKEKKRRLREEGEYIVDSDDDGEGMGETQGAEVQGGHEGDDPMVGTHAENRREVSWIWTGAGSTGTDAELEDVLRIEWTKARARARRWEEEVELLEEEYRRVLISFEHEAAGWEDRAKAIPVGTARLAYALKQAAMYRTLACKVTQSMTEVHRGRGQKRVPAVDAGASSDEESADGSEEEEDTGAGNVHEDEEFFFGGRG